MVMVVVMDKGEGGGYRLALAMHRFAADGGAQPDAHHLRRIPTHGLTNDSVQHTLSFRVACAATVNPPATTTANTRPAQTECAAREQNVDCLVLAGDLFHDAKPSRATLYRTMTLLRKYCMGYNPVRIQVVSDQALVFGSGLATGTGGGSTVAGAAFNRVNYEDPHYNVGLPIFSIHGNHDDPQREGDLVLAALDLLSAANLINYIGKSDAVDKVDVHPLLLAKGKTRVALYGLGHIRDDRLHRAMISRDVHFHRPADNPASWFSMLLLHQNRPNRTSSARTGSTDLHACLPSFIDLVVWGHEHESKMLEAPGSAQNKAAKNPYTYILQPGSSVATSLSDGEAAPKNVFLVQVRGVSFRCDPVRLRCVRPFRLAVTSLSQLGINPDVADVESAMIRALKARVEAMLDEEAVAAEERPENELPPAAMSLPLIRLKVEHTGFQTVSNQRFGSLFLGRVANPGDMLLFYRDPSIAGAERRSRLSAADAGAAAAAAGLAPMMPAAIEAVRVEDLVMEQLAANAAGKAGSMEMIALETLNLALKRFVDQADAAAIREVVDDALRENQAEASKAAVRKPDDVKNLAHERREKASAAAPATADEEERELQADATTAAFGGRELAPAARTAKAAASNATSAAARSHGAAGSRGRAAGRGARDEEDDDGAQWEDVGDDEEELDDEGDDALMDEPVVRTAAAAQSRRRQADEDEAEDHGDLASSGSDDDEAGSGAGRTTARSRVRGGPTAQQTAGAAAKRGGRGGVASASSRGAAGPRGGGRASSAASKPPRPTGSQVINIDGSDTDDESFGTGASGRRRADGDDSSDEDFSGSGANKRRRAETGGAAASSHGGGGRGRGVGARAAAPAPSAKNAAVPTAVGGKRPREDALHAASATSLRGGHGGATARSVSTQRKLPF